MTSTVNHYAIEQYAQRHLANSKGMAEAKFEKYRSHDPFPETPCALLNSEDVLKYICATGMIYPFYPNKLSGVTYEVIIKGPTMFWDDNGALYEKDLNYSGQIIKLEKNSITFVTLEPHFKIPDYPL